MGTPIKKRLSAKKAQRIAGRAPRRSYSGQTTGNREAIKDGRQERCGRREMEGETTDRSGR